MRRVALGVQLVTSHINVTLLIHDRDLRTEPRYAGTSKRLASDLLIPTAHRYQKVFASDFEERLLQPEGQDVRVEPIIGSEEALSQ